MGAGRSWHITGIQLLFLLLVTGCAAPPPPLPVPPFNPKASRLIIFRPSAWSASGSFGLVKINGVESCGLANGAAYVKDVAPGPVTVTGTISQATIYQFGTSKLSFTASAGQTYYIVFTLNSNSFGLFGLLAESPGESGAWSITLDEAGQYDLGKITPVGCADEG